MLFFVLTARNGVSIMSSEEQEPTAHSLKCPRCGSNDLRRSKSDGLIAVIQRIAGRWPFRCRSCRKRFYRHSSPPDYHDCGFDVIASGVSHALRITAQDFITPGVSQGMRYFLSPALFSSALMSAGGSKRSFGSA